MVKNKIGGNRSKKVARKNVNNISQERRLRFVELEDEMYAVVTNIIGNGQVKVLGTDDKERLCFIRYKFSGRNKHNNLLTMGSWVIIGNRSWETVIEGKLPKCDLLEIYTNQEKNRLIQECKVNLSALLREEQKQMNLDDQTEQDNIVFSLEDNNTFEKETIKENGTNTHEEEDDFDIDFDNI